MTYIIREFFIFSPLFGKYGSKIGTKVCFNIGAVMQGVSGFLFAFLPYCEGVALFISLSYLLRFVEGLGTAMAWSSALGILMQIFPNKVKYQYKTLRIILYSRKL